MSKAVIQVGEEKTFTIISNNLSDNNFYIQSAKLNGKTWNKTFIRHEDIMNGGELIFEMGSEPNKNWATDKDSKPYFQ